MATKRDFYVLIWLKNFRNVYTNESPIHGTVLLDMYIYICIYIHSFINVMLPFTETRNLHILQNVTSGKRHNSYLLVFIFTQPELYCQNSGNKEKMLYHEVGEIFKYWQPRRQKSKLFGVNIWKKLVVSGFLIHLAKCSLVGAGAIRASTKSAQIVIF